MSSGSWRTPGWPPPTGELWRVTSRPPGDSYLRWLADYSLLALERDDHRRVRRLVTTALTPRAVARMDRHEERFRRLAKPVITNALPFEPDATESQAESALIEFTAWIRDMAEERRAVPHDDLISDLATIHDMGDQMTSEQDRDDGGRPRCGWQRDHGSRWHGRHHDLARAPRRVRRREGANRSPVPSAVLEVIRYGRVVPVRCLAMR